MRINYEDMQSSTPEQIRDMISMAHAGAPLHIKFLDGLVTLVIWSFKGALRGYPLYSENKDKS